MKKIFAIMMLLAVTVSASAASYKKLYVNPGHGGYTSNDRQTSMPAVNGVKFTETKGCFWESEGNTYRAWGIEYFWKKRVNNNVKLSRYENTQSGDKTLSVIAQESNAYGGAFMSLHTNAGNASANYMIIMCGANGKGTTTAKNATSLKMAKDAAYWQGGEATAGLSSKGYGARAQNHMTQKSYKTDRGMTDRAFYSGDGLGVLNTNNAPGYLAESWFHDYRPEAFRLMSVGYNYFLAWQLMRAYLDSPGLEGVNLYPIIFGDIRDTKQPNGYQNSGYAARNRDAYLAINGAKVTLTNKATGGSKTYTTDKFNNGFYTFYDCVPGATYIVTVEKGGKYMQKTITVSNDAKGTQHKLNFNWDDAITGTATPTMSMSPSTSSVKFDKVVVNTTEEEVVEVSAVGLTSDITITSSNNDLFKLSTTTLAKTGGSFSITYAPTAVGTQTGTITLKSGSITKTITLTGVCRNQTIYFNPGWFAGGTDLGWENNLTNKNTDIWHYSNIRNIAYGNGKLYLSCQGTNKIHVLNARTGEWLCKLDMTGVEGGAAKFCDIKFVGGKVVVSTIANEATNELKVYSWDDDYAAPKCILNTTMPANFDRVGDTFSVKGDLNNGAIYYAGHRKDVDCNSIICYPIVNGVVNATPSITSIHNDEISLGAGARIIAETSGKFWVEGSAVYPTLLDADGQKITSVPAAAIFGTATPNTNGNSFKTFTFKGVTYGMAVKLDADLKNGKAAMFDATNGWDAAYYVESYPLKGLGTNSEQQSWHSSSSIEIAVNGDQGVEAWISVAGQGIVYIKSGIVPESTVKISKLTVDKEELSMEAVAKQTAIGTVRIEGENLAGNIELGISGEGAEAFSIANTILETPGEVEVVFAPVKEGTYNAVLTVASSGAESKRVELVGVATPNLNELGELKEVWNYSAAKNSIPTWIVNNPFINAEGKQSIESQAIRSIAYTNGKLYILQNKGVGTPSVDIADAFTGAQLGELNMTGVADGIVNLSSLVAVDGVVLGSNVGLCATEAASRIESEPETFAGVELETLKVYKWTSDNAAPEVLISDATHADMSTGAKISFSGTMKDGRIWFTNNEENAVLYYEVKNGVASQTPVVINLMSGETLFHAAGAETSAWGAGSVFYNESDGSILVDFKDDVPTIFAAPVLDTATNKYYAQESVHIPVGLLGSRFGSDSKIFFYRDKRYVVCATYLGEDNTENGGVDERLHHGAFALLDITDGIENVTSNMGVYPAEGLGNWKNDHFNNTLCVNERENGVDIWVCSYTQGVAYYYYGVDGATGIEGVDTELDAPVEYYNLQGVKVVNPSNGLFIKKQGNKVTKVIL